MKATKEILAAGGTVALFVADSQLPDEHVLAAFGRWRSLVPTARRMIAAPTDRFLVDAEALRPGMAKGKYDAYLLMPRGVRDEEFHNSITDLLSDWGSTVARPEVVSAKIITTEVTALVAGIRDYLDRTGIPNQVYAPDSEVGRHVLAQAPPDSPLPVVWAMNGRAIPISSVRDVAVAMYGAPDVVSVSEVVDVVVVGGGPAGLATAVYASSEGLNTVVLEAEAIGGQAGTSSMIRNYLGFPRGISGMRLAQRARNQALRFGTRFFSGWEVDELIVGEPHILRTGAERSGRMRSSCPRVSATANSASNPWRISSASACTTAQRWQRPARWRTRMCTSWVEATLLDRPPYTWPASRSPSPS